MALLALSAAVAAAVLILVPESIRSRVPWVGRLPAADLFAWSALLLAVGVILTAAEFAWSGVNARDRFDFPGIEE